MYKFIIGVFILLILVVNNTQNSYSAFTDVVISNGNYINVGNITSDTIDNSEVLLEFPVSYPEIIINE